MTDQFNKIGKTVIDPPDSASSVILDTDFDNTSRSLWVSQSGNIRLELASNQIVTYPSVPVGRFVIRATKVFTTGTTANVDLYEW